MGSDLPPAATGWCTSSTPGEKWVGTVKWQASSWLEQATHIQSLKALLGGRHPVGCTDHPCAVTEGTIGWQASSWLEQATHIQSPKALLGGRHPVGWNRPPIYSHRRHCWVTGIQLVGTGHPCTVHVLPKDLELYVCMSAHFLGH